jgi:hypothetical protein
MKTHEVHHVLRLAGELVAQLRVLGGDADRAGVEVAHAHHDAAERRPAGAVAKPNSSAPSSAAMTTSRPGLELAVGLDARCGCAGC